MPRASIRSRRWPATDVPTGAPAFRQPNLNQVAKMTQSTEQGAGGDLEPVRPGTTLLALGRLAGKPLKRVGPKIAGPDLGAARRPWRRLSSRLYGALAAAVLALAAGMWVSHMPMRERVRIEAKLASNFTRAPVLAIGDSITFEAAPRHLCGARVFNAAVPGDGLADLIADAPDFAVRLAPQRVVIAIGVNDSARPDADVEVWAEDYRTLVALFAGRDLVLVEINPVDPARSPDIALLDQAFIRRANAAIRAIGAEVGARVVPAPAQSITRDGLHPTLAGAFLWRARLAEAACRG